MYVKALVLYLLAWITAAYQPMEFSEMKPDSDVGSEGSTLFFPIDGNVYPKGNYTVNISIGNPPKAYSLDIDTGSDLTWVTHVALSFFSKPPPNHYDPTKGSLVSCGDPDCKSLGNLGNNDGMSPDAPCRYVADYADGGSSTGVLVRYSFPLTLRNGTTVTPQLAFGCGYHNKDEVSIHQPVNDGILGLGRGAPGILKQLSSMGVIRNVVGHCLSAQGGGYLFFGDIPIFGIVWKQISSDAEQYSLGSANILLGGEATDIRGLEIIFDSGSTYTYLNSKAYGALLDLVTKNLNGLKDAVEDTALPVCWKGEAPIGSIDEVASHFLPLAFNFTDEKNVQFQMDPKSYLIISEKGNVCFGILNGTKVGLKDLNVIGGISMQDKLVIYHNENERVGWAAVKTCNLKF
ncbi:aspartic proteinase asp1 [Phtheirospermum japonicum]|uniref:Aspartic proteinase asp1 n=1 Tax=Phtheirospermum japonicum TaxID=374723 RepID=A0A830C0A5_9LAMI|nr:aspartic proteinase asp1 [Phtheirospermum japonicum]